MLFHIDLELYGYFAFVVCEDAFLWCIQFYQLSIFNRYRILYLLIFFPSILLQLISDIEASSMLFCLSAM